MRYIDADKLKSEFDYKHIDMNKTAACVHHKNIIEIINQIPTADVVEVDKAQKEIDYWHDKAQSYEQTIVKLTLNQADVVEVVRCKDCKKYNTDDCMMIHGKKMNRNIFANDYCSYGEKA